MRLKHILVPVADSPSPRLTLNVLTDLLACLGVSPSTVRLIHIGDEPPEVFGGSAPETGATVELIDGPVVETILRVTREQGMDMIVMPTAGQQGFDVLGEHHRAGVAPSILSGASRARLLR